MVLQNNGTYHNTTWHHNPEDLDFNLTTMKTKDKLLTSMQSFILAKNLKKYHPQVLAPFFSLLVCFHSMLTFHIEY
jgi:hypothetical protein